MLEDNKSLGVDFKTGFEFFNDDIVLISEEDNLIQAIINRINTYYDSLNLFYEDYGSNLKNFLGWFKNEESLKFIILEIKEILKQDPRLVNFDVTGEYGDKGVIDIFLNIYFDDETDLSLNLVINEDGGVTIADN